MKNTNNSPSPLNIRKSLSIYSSTTMTVIIGILHFYISTITNKFAEVFDSFGTELPWITTIVVYSPVYYWGIPIIAALFFTAHHFGIINKTSVVLGTAMLTIASIVFTITAVYLPIFQLGAIVK